MEYYLIFKYSLDVNNKKNKRSSKLLTWKALYRFSFKGGLK